MPSRNRKKTLRIISTVRATGDKMSSKNELPFKPDASGQENNLICLYPEAEFQEIEGFGGAFTEAGAVTLQTLNPKKQEEILNAYFNPETGLGYSLCRTHINSCDFSIGNYAYAETPGDTELRDFSIGRDRKALIPFIRTAKRVRDANFKLFASPWSPPAWMKTSGRMNGGGKLKEEYRGAWARYFVKYIKAYAEEGIDIWGVTVQNEPKAVQTWDSCVFTAEEERDFVKNHLGPVLKKNGLGGIKIIIWDHNKERVYERAKAVYADRRAAKYVWGAAFHWYSGDHFRALEALHHEYPGKKLLFTEGCQEAFGSTDPWAAAERYAHDIIGDLLNWTTGWVDWNMILDEQGGPNHAGNYCEAPVIVHTKTGAVTYAPSFYYLGHFSKFIRPGARRIGCSSFTDKLEACAFRNKDGSRAAVVLNRGDAEIPFTLRCECGLADAASPAHSIMTMVY
ncbi:MAG: glycoside hydrolase family 30 protein [Bacillota bacterium]